MLIGYKSDEYRQSFFFLFGLLFLFLLPRACGSVKVSGKLSTHPTPNPCFSLTCDLRAETWVRGGVFG